MKATTLSHAAVCVLDAMAIDGSIARITAGQLDRKLYVEVNKALEALGGKWNRKANGHVFDGDPRDALERVVIDGAFRDARKDFDLFVTPPELATRLVEMASPSQGCSALEPSAGAGAIATALLAAGCRVTCVELQERLCVALRDDGFAAIQGDLLAWAPAQARFDRVVMNPPFSRQQDIAHVTHAFGLLRPGGRLVSVMSSGVTFRQTKAAVAFRELVEAHGWIEELPPRSFHSSGTDVNTVVVVMEADG